MVLTKSSHSSIASRNYHVNKKCPYHIHLIIIIKIKKIEIDQRVNIEYD